MCYLLKVIRIIGGSSLLASIHLYQLSHMQGLRSKRKVETCHPPDLVVDCPLDNLLMQYFESFPFQDPILVTGHLTQIMRPGQWSVHWPHKADEHCCVVKTHKLNILVKRYAIRATTLKHLS